MTAVLKDLVGCLVMFLLGGGCGLIGYRLVRLGLASTTWPTVPGAVTRSEVVTLRRKRVFYSAVAAYTYTVLEREYTEKTIHPGQGARDFPTPEAAATFLKAYPVGAPVTVHYDPADPERACLVPGATGAGWATLVMGATILLLSLYGFHDTLSRL